MSTILDALRKSERARRAGRAPAYGNAGEPRAPSVLRWSTIIAGMALLIALATLAWLLQRHPPEINVETTPVAVPESVPAANAPATGAVSAPRVPPESKPELKPDAAMSRSSPAPVLAAPAIKRPPAVVVIPGNAVPLWSSLPEAERAGLPPLHVNIHVYTPDETQRILYINNQPRVRGEEVVPGVVVDEIVPEGAIVRYRGQRYLLPRPT